MSAYYLENLFGLSGKTALVTGGAGVLCSAMALGLSQVGANVVVLNRTPESGLKVVDQIHKVGGKAMAVACNVLDKTGLEIAADRVLQAYGRIDILINGAGGNRKEANTTADQPFFDLSEEALRAVIDLNLIGTLLPCQVFGQTMVKQGEGSILNVTSTSAYRPLTRVVAYSAAKAGIINFTQWLAVYMAQGFSPRIRVNAVAPGFFLGQQNRAMLVDETSGELTPRGKKIIDHTPMGRFGDPSELVGAVLWLLSPAASFVTGVVIPVDGGFSAYSGV